MLDDKIIDKIRKNTREQLVSLKNNYIHAEERIKEVKRYLESKFDKVNTNGIESENDIEKVINDLEEIQGLVDMFKSIDLDEIRDARRTL